MAITSALSGLGLYEKPRPLISFSTMVDQNMSLLVYMIKNYHDSVYFDAMEKLKSKTYYDLLWMVYTAPTKNPLHLLSEKPENESFLNELYQECMSDNKILKDILSDGITTDIYKLFLDFVNSPDIIPSILCYNNIQKEIMDKNLGTNKYTILLDDVNTSYQSQFYLEYFDDISSFKTLAGKTFYISSKFYNLDMDKKFGDLKPEYDEDIVYIMKNQSKINIFDMYNKNVFKNTATYKRMQEKGIIE